MGNELIPTLEELPAVLRRAAEAADQLRMQRSTSPPTEPATRYFKRSTAPDGAGGRVWDKAVAELKPKGLVFRPGKECLIRCEDYFRWIEAHPVKAESRERPADEPDDAPIPFDRARARARGGRFR